MKLQYTQRPPNFRINPSHLMAKHIVFAGLGQQPNSGRFTDASLKKTHGTPVNFPKWTQARELGRWGMVCIENQSLDVPSKVWQQPLTNPFTFGCWIHFTGTANTDLFLLKGSNNNTSGGFGYYIDAGGGDGQIACYYRPSGVNRTVRTYSGDLRNAWTHVAMSVVPGTGLIAYVNGLVEATVAEVAAGTLNSTAPIKLIASASGSDRLISVVDPLLYIGRVLSSSEIADLADPSNVMLSVGGDPLLIEDGPPVGAKTYFTFKNLPYDSILRADYWHGDDQCSPIILDVNKR